MTASKGWLRLAAISGATVAYAVNLAAIIPGERHLTSALAVAFVATVLEFLSLLGLLSAVVWIVEGFRE